MSYLHISFFLGTKQAGKHYKTPTGAFFGSCHCKCTQNKMPLIPNPRRPQRSSPSRSMHHYRSSRHCLSPPPLFYHYSFHLRSRLVQSRSLPPTTTILVRRRRTRIPGFARVRTRARASDQGFPLLPPLLQLNACLVSGLGANKWHSSQGTPRGANIRLRKWGRRTSVSATVVTIVRRQCGLGSLGLWS